MAKEFISPISIDLGAANTGVFFAHYAAGEALANIQKKGRIYKLRKDGKDDYTLLMAKRTATRHQRRGFDRRQMAKRLFKLIWEKKLDLSWGSDVQ